MRSETEIRKKFIEQLEEYNERLKARIKPFEDSYFNGLSPIEIAELAKKSIRLTCENRRLEDLLQEIKAIVEEDCEFCDDLGGCADGCTPVEIRRIIADED